jgi:PKD repeat protein
MKMKSCRKALIAIVGILMILLILKPPVNPTIASTPPVAQFTYTPKTPLINETVTFDASASYDPDGTKIICYKWDFGDGTPAASTPQPTITHAYSALGNYTVTLTVYDEQGESGSTSAVVAVIWYPIAKFTFTPLKPLVNETVTFNATESKAVAGSIVSYYWNFGDGATANVTTPIITHAYANVGTYTVKLTVLNGFGLSNSTSQSITVVKPPIADFTYTPTWPKVGESVTFDASTSKPNGGTIISYFWDFGDGTNATGKIVSHSYSAYGTYTVTLTIQDSEGFTDTTSKQLNVRQYPRADFAFAPSLPYVNETVTFNASASTPEGGTIVSYLWNFGDGSTATGMVVTHAYTSYGTYVVTLTVTDSEELTSTCTKQIRVIIRPVAKFTRTPQYPLVNQPILFNASESYDPDGKIVSYIWNFGDGNITTVYEPTIYHAYSKANIYKVQLTVIDNDGLTASAEMIVAVYTTVPTHDVAVMEVKPSAVRVVVGTTIYINVTVENQGTATETFDVEVYFNHTLLGKQTVSNLPPITNQTLTFQWNTTGLAHGYYVIEARASPVVDETDIADNVKSSSDIVEIGELVWMEVQPEITEIGLLNKAFTVNVNIRKLQAYWRAIGIQFRLCYNDTLLEVLNVTEGPFMKDPAWNLYGTFFIYYIEKDAIYGPHVLVGVMLYPNQTGYWNAYPSGSGTIATITFKAIYQERGLTKPPLECPLKLVDTMIIDSDLIEIPFASHYGKYRIYPTNIADFNYDGKVDMRDVARVARAFGSDPTIYPERWDPVCDVNNDNKIDMRDVAVSARNFGWTTPYDP